jgi:tetratricopeptide (TPR) repeat protein
MTSPRPFLIALLVVLGSHTGKATSAVDTLVDASWRAWEAQDYALAEKQFGAAIAADPANPRGYIGLALLENMREEYRQCWDALRLLSNKEPNIHPYLFSFWQTIRFRLKNEFRETGLLEYLERLSSAADDRGVLPPQIAEALEEYYRERHMLREANEWHMKTNAISDWMLIGPFENVSASGYEKVYPPETEFNAAATYEGKGGVPASWFPIASTVANTWIDFTRHFGFKKSIFYANTFIYSPRKRSVHVRVGTSGSLRAFLNDEMILEDFDENNNDLDTYIAAAELQQGWNRILIKCGFSDIDKCNFLVRIVDEHGKPIEGLRVSTGVQPYPHKPSAPVTLLENSFESFFKKQLELYPDRAENYALLAQLYLRDDRAPQAERILRSALQRWSRCTLFYTLMMEAYQRGEKQDEIEELLAKLSTINKQLPQVLGYRIAEALRNEEYQKVEELLNQLKNQGYNPEYVYQIEMGLLGKKKEIDKLVTLAAEAHAKYPLNWDFAELQALIESEIHHDPEKAAGVVKTYLTRNYGLIHLFSMASYYLKAGKLDKWEESMREALDLSPTATGYVYSMGQVYQLAKDYPKAEEAFRRALALCPTSSLYWSKLAEVYKATGRTDDAKAAYSTALMFDSKDFASREALRALEGKRPIFSAFTSFNIDSLIRTAPNKKDYENDEAVILLDDTKRVVYERGASMVTAEILVKVFSTRGIDAWKENSINYNKYNEELIVEKAVTIKRDGTEVKADVNNGEVVFKSLEPNDCIYMKWKVKNYYSGMLAKHFWDTHYFNGFFPTRINRYSLMVPKDVQFTHRTQFTQDEPSVQQTDEGVLYEWQLRNEPAVRYEQGMPVFQDVGKMLYVSSLPSWEYIASWYSDLARTKTRATFEIKDQVASLFNGKTEMGDEEKVKVIHDFITEHIRYSSVSFRQSAYVPQRARDVLVQRLGDCKDMATLCIAMLNELGIKAHYVLVNTWNDGYNRNIPPGIAFNHCIVGVDLKSGVRHIDLTAADYPIGSIPPVVNGAFSLAIEDSSHMPMHLAPRQFQTNNLARTSTAFLNDDNSMKFICSSRRTGAVGARVRSHYRNKSKAECIKSLTETLSNDYPNVEVKDITIKNIDRLDSVIEDSQEYNVPQFISESGGFKLIRMPWTDKLETTEALSYESRKYPYILGTANDTLMETLRVKFPAGYAMQEVPKSMTLSNSAGTYIVKYKQSKGELIGTRTLIFKKPEVNPDEYLEYKKFYNAALKEDNRQLLLKKVK